MQLSANDSHAADSFVCTRRHAGDPIVRTDDHVRAQPRESVAFHFGSQSALSDHFRTKTHTTYSAYYNIYRYICICMVS